MTGNYCGTRRPTTSIRNQPDKIISDGCAATRTAEEFSSRNRRAVEMRLPTPRINNQPEGTPGRDTSDWCVTLWHASGVNRGIGVPLITL